MPELGRALVVLGVVAIVVGVLFMVGVRLPLGRLPGDVVIRRPNTTFYFPIVSCLVVSVVLSLILGLFWRR